MSDPISSASKTDTQPKRTGFKRLIKTILFASVLLVVALGVSSYYLSFPFIWPSGLWSAKSSEVEERLSALEGRIDSELSNGAMGAQIEQEVEQALADFSSGQSRWRSEFEAAIQQQLETASAQMSQLTAAIDEISSRLSDIESEFSSQATRTLEFNDRLDQYQSTLQEMRAQVNAAQSAVESGLDRPVTEQDVQDFLINRAELVNAFWAIREVQELVNQGSKAQALTSYDNLLTQWRQSANQDLNALVPLMTQKQAMLSNWTPIQWNQWQERIQNWLGQLHGWQFNNASDALDRQTLAREAASESDRQGWLARMRHLFSGIVRVRSRDLAALSDRDQRVARANVEQRLLLLQMAVASQNVDSVQSQAADLYADIVQLFDPIDTQSARNGLQALAAIKDSSPPDLFGEAEQTIEQALYQP